jgi:hypothetical protein
MSGDSRSQRIVWIIAGQSVLLLFLVVLFLTWKGSTSERIWQLQHGSAGNRFDAALEFARSGRAAMVAAPALKDALEDSDVHVQTAAADALLRMGAWEQLNSSDWIRKADASSITAATTDIGNAFPPPLEAFPVLQNVLRNHPSADVRAQAAVALGRYGARAIPDLQAASQDSDPIVRNSAQATLSIIQARQPFRR